MLCYKDLTQSPFASGIIRSSNLAVKHYDLLHNNVENAFI